MSLLFHFSFPPLTIQIITLIPLILDARPPHFTPSIFYKIMRSERVQRSEAFRKSIRREELDDYFAKRRKQLIMAEYEREMNEIKDSLKTCRQQEDYLT